MELLVFLGYEAQELSTFAGAAGAIVTAAGTAAVLGLALSPLFSDEWAERLGVADEHRGADPAEVIPGRSGPLPERSASDETDAATESTADATDADAPAVTADAAE